MWGFLHPTALPGTSASTWITAPTRPSGAPWTASTSQSAACGAACAAGAGATHRRLSLGRPHASGAQASHWARWFCAGGVRFSGFSAHRAWRRSLPRRRYLVKRAHHPAHRSNDPELQRHTRFWTTLMLYDVVQVGGGEREVWLSVMRFVGAHVACQGCRPHHQQQLPPVPWNPDC